MTRVIQLQPKREMTFPSEKKSKQKLKNILMVDKYANVILDFVQSGSGQQTMALLKTALP